MIRYIAQYEKQIPTYKATISFMWETQQLTNNGQCFQLKKNVNG